MLEARWVFVVKVQEQPGVLTSVASVFSSRGVSLSMVLVSHAAKEDSANPTILLSFSATPRKVESLRRILGRLSRVLETRAYPYDSPDLRAIAMVKLPSGAKPVLPAGVRGEVLTGEAGPTTIQLVGRPPAVDSAIDGIRNSCGVDDVVISVMAL